MQNARGEQKIKKKKVALICMIMSLVLFTGCGGKSNENVADQIGSEVGSDLQVNEEGTEVDETEENLPRVEGEVFVTKETIQSTYSDLLKGYTYEYDESNRLIKKEYWIGEEGCSERYEYTYDDNGNIVCETYVVDASSQNPTEVYTYTWEYDEAGNLVTYKMVYNNDNSFNTITEYKYDERGNLLDEYCRVYPEEENGFLGRITYEYDANNRVIKKMESYSEGEIYQWETYEYDAAGNQVRTLIGYNTQSEASIEQKFEYDDRGNLIKHTNIQRGELAWYIVYEYDEEGRVLKKLEYNEKDELGKSYLYEYDKWGNEIQYEEAWQGEVQIRKNREYDENGIMIRMSNYRMDTCEVIEWIEYEYFIVPEN